MQLDTAATYQRLSLALRDTVLVRTAEGMVDRSKRTKSRVQKYTGQDTSRTGGQTKAIRKESRKEKESYKSKTTFLLPLYRAG